jgi:hypothetical protein
VNRSGLFCVLLAGGNYSPAFAVTHSGFKNSPLLAMHGFKGALHKSNIYF